LHSLLNRQLRAARRGRTDGSLDIDALLASVVASYLEFERERRLADRAGRLMEEEILEANARIQREARDTLAAVFQGVHEGILQLGEDGRILSANPAAERILASSEEKLVGRDLRDLVHVGQLLPGRTIETATVASGGTGREIEISFAAYRSDGKPHLLALVRDIAERKARERELIEAREAAENANLSKSHFLASMSHELRTPLNAVLGFAEVIRDRHFGDDAIAKYAEYADGIHASGRHLLSLIDDILDLSKIEFGGPTLRTAPVDLGALANEAVEMMRGIAADKHLDLRIVAPGAPVTVAADARALRQVALNLLSNAVKFTPPEGRVEAIVEADSGARLTVRDTGIGIAREDLDHLFEPFHRGNSQVAREHPGTGLGLVITRKLVEMHGGRIELKSDPGRGTSVTVSLPKLAA
jgi:cell cycle sensor histidine kinase DivJ